MMRDPYVQGAHDPWAAAPGSEMSGAMQNQAQGQGGMPPAAQMQQQGMQGEQMAQEQMEESVSMRHGLSEDVIGNPISVEEAYLGSMRGMLGRQIGAYIAATFLMGNGEMVRWEGRLYEVGNNYLILYQQLQGRYVVGDLNSLRFVEFMEEGESTALKLRTCSNGPTSW